MTLEGLLADYRSKEISAESGSSRWYTIAAVSLAAVNAGKDLPQLYNMATQDLSIEDEKLVQRRIKEAILKTSPLYGVGRSMQALLPLFDVIGEDRLDEMGPRYESFGKAGDAEKRAAKGRAFFDVLWTPELAQRHRDKNIRYQPDLYLLNMRLMYEYWISDDSILSDLETQMCMAAALTCSNCPLQAMWHTRGILRHGGTPEEARFVQKLAIAMCKLYGVDAGACATVDDIMSDMRKSKG